MIRLKTSATLLLALALSTAVSFANDGDKKMDRDPSKMADKMADKIIKDLKLSDAQAAKVKAVFEDGAKEMDHMRMGPEKMHEDFMKQMTAATVDTAAMNREFADHMAKMQLRHSIMVRHFAELHDALTADQRAQLAKIMEKRHDEMMNKWKDHKDGMGKGKVEVDEDE